MDGLLLIRANPFHLQALAAAPISGHEVRAVILQPRWQQEAAARFPEAEIITFPTVYDAPATGVTEELIAALAPHEAEILLMLDRQNRWGASLMAVRAYYLKLLDYCSTLLATRSFSGLVFYDVPQQGFDYIIYLIARKLDIPVAIATYTQLNDRVVVLTSIDDYPKPPETVSLSPGVAVKSAPSRYMEKGILQQRSPEFHSSRSKKLRPVSYSPAHLLNRMRRDLEHFPLGIPDQSLNGLSRFTRNWAARGEHKRAMAFYRSVSKMEPGSADYVFFPLQLQPEATTLPRAGYMLDQVNYARLVASVLPDGWRLAIKEHPASLRFRDDAGRARAMHFYRDLRSVPNSDLLDLRSDTDALIDGCRYLITGTGTPGWEAINRGRPVIVFGWPWYSGAPGVTRATDRDALRALFRVDAPKASGPSQEELERYVAWLTSEGTAPGRFGREETTSGFSEADLRAYTDAVAAALSRSSSREVMREC
jgi:hypothetical protein